MISAFKMAVVYVVVSTTVGCPKSFVWDYFDYNNKAECFSRCIVDGDVEEIFGTKVNESSQLKNHLNRKFS